MSDSSYEGRAGSLSGPAARLAAVTPDDAGDLPLGPCRALFVAEGGALTVTDLAGGDVVALSSSDNQYHPIRVTRVHATGTTALGIVALY